MHIRAWRRSWLLQALVAALVLGAALTAALVLLISDDSGGRVEATDELSVVTATPTARATPTATPTATAEPTATATAAPTATPAEVVLASACGITVKAPGEQGDWGTASVTQNVEGSCHLLIVEVTPAEGYCFAGEGLVPRDPLPTTCASGTTWTVLRWADMTFYVYFAPTSFPYDTFDTTGAVTASGSYVFLTEGAASALDGESDAVLHVVTTYEELREEEGLLRLHLTDAGGASHADFYATVAVGDILEWRKADDCFTRYTVTSIPALAADAGYREFGVAPVTYAFTGCSGALAAPAGEGAREASATAPVIAVDVGFGDLPNLGGEGLTAPVVHGIYQLVPEGWSGATKAYELNVGPGAPSYENPVFTESLAEARKLPYWREPDLPAGWSFSYAVSGNLAGPARGYTAEYVRADGYPAFTLEGYHASSRYYPGEASYEVDIPVVGGKGMMVLEARTIAGRPAIALYSPPGPKHPWNAGIWLWVYDAATESEYHFIGATSAVKGANLDSAIAIVESLFD